MNISADQNRGAFELPTSLTRVILLLGAAIGLALAAPGSAPPVGSSPQLSVSSASPKLP